jgi:hypothetical protein
VPISSGVQNGSDSTGVRIGTVLDTGGNRHLKSIQCWGWWQNLESPGQGLRWSANRYPGCALGV